MSSTPLGVNASAWLACFSLLCLSCTSPSEPGKLDPDDSSADSPIGPRPDSTDSWKPVDTAIQEVCDGVDNDGDGVVDEGSADVDLDGVADCVDTSCEIETFVGGEVDASTSGGDRPASAEPWEVEVLFEVSDLYCSGFAAADVDADGGLNLLCPQAFGEPLVQVSLTDGSIVTVPDLSYSTSATAMAVGDIDGDGAFEAVGYHDYYMVKSAELDGSVDWTSEPLIACGAPSEFDITLLDLHHDGQAEVVWPPQILDGTTGDEALPTFDCDELKSLVSDYRGLAVEDIDLDGTFEILVAGRVISAETGAVLWEWESLRPHEFDIYPLVLQMDADPEGEVAFVLSDRILLFDTDGTMLYEMPFGVDVLNEDDEHFQGYPCAGDIDGDTFAEIVSVTDVNVHAWSTIRGEELWTSPASQPDTWGAVGCTTFDLDGDGAKEVLFNDEISFKILDGPTGAVLFEDPEVVSRTCYDQPMPLDVDGDGSTEIVLVTNCPDDAHPVSVRVYGNVNRDWPRGGRIWPWSNWSGTGMYEDGRIPRTYDPPWLTTNVWRGQPEDLPHGADLSLAVLDACVSSCEEGGQVRLAVQLSDHGPEELSPGAPIAVYSLVEGDERSFVTVVSVPDWVDDATSAASVEVVLTTAQARGGLVLVAGDDGSASPELLDEDFDTSNNEVRWSFELCDPEGG